MGGALHSRGHPEFLIRIVFVPRLNAIEYSYVYCGCGRRILCLSWDNPRLDRIRNSSAQILGYPPCPAYISDLLSLELG